MHHTSIRRAAVAIAGAAVVFVGGSQALASGPHASAAKAVTVTIKLKGTGDQAMPYFDGPKTVKAGSKLTIKNTTSAQEIGPHSFSLVKPKVLPETEAEINKCGGSETTPPAGLCLKIAKAHKVDLQSGKVGKPTIDAGAKGWDTAFGKTGDSWVTENKGDSQTRRVTAKPGTTLTFFCAVHPFMKVKIRVTK